MSKAYRARSNVRHDGDYYAPGDLMQDLSEEAAKTLIEAGVIEEVTEKQQAEQAAAAAPAAPQPDGFPARNLPPAQPQVQSQPAPASSQTNVPTPEQVVASAAPANGQPSPDEVAATAEQVA